MEDAKGKGGTETLREDGTPGPGGEETDEVALRRRKGEKGGWMAKEAAKDADKGWWFVTRQVKIFTLLDQNLFGRRMQAMIIKRLGGHSGDRNGVSR